MIKTRKTIWIIILSAVMLVSSFWAVIFDVFWQQTASAEDDETLPYVSFTKSEYDDEDGKITLTVQLFGNTPDADGLKDISVHYHTESNTAIEGIDFTRVSNTLQFNKSLTETIEIFVNTTTQKKSFTLNDGTNEYMRYFSVVLDSAVNAKVVTDSSVAKCRIRGGISLNLSTTKVSKNSVDTISFLEEYMNVQSYARTDSKGLYDGEVYNSWETFKLTLVNDTTTGWINDFIDSGLASAYGMFTTGGMGWKNSQHSNDYFLVFGNAQLETDGKQFIQVDDQTAQTLLPGVLANLYVDFHYGDPLIIAAFSTYKRQHWSAVSALDFLAGKNPYDQNEERLDIYMDKSWMDRMNGEIFSTYMSYKDGVGKNFAKESYFFKIAPYNNQLDMRMLVSIEEGEDKIFHDPCFKAEMFLHDSVAPKLVDTYMDDSSLATTGILRVILRFSEPVYSPDENSLVVDFGTESTSYSCTFDYVGGNYTDTFYYELDVANYVRAGTQFRYFIQTDNYRVVPAENHFYDFALNYDSEEYAKNNKLEKVSTDKYTRHILTNGKDVYPDQKQSDGQAGTDSSSAFYGINYRDPDIKATKDNVDFEKSEKFNQEYNLKVGIGKIDLAERKSNGAANGKIYYSWVSDAGSSQISFGKNPNDYTYSAKIENFSAVDCSLPRMQKIALTSVTAYGANYVIMKYAKSDVFVIDGKKYCMDEYNTEDGGNVFHDLTNNQTYTFDGRSTYKVFIDNKTFIFANGGLTVERAGNYYLYVYAVSEYNIEATRTFGPYKLDGSAPVITADVPDNTQLSVKEFELEFYDLPDKTLVEKVSPYASGVSKVIINVNYNGTVIQGELIKDGKVTNAYKYLVKKDTNSDTKWTYRSSVDSIHEPPPEGSYGNLDPIIYKIMDDNQSTRLVVDISFTVIDGCGNSYSTSAVSYTYDLSEGFNATMALSQDGTGTELEPLFTANRIPVYNSQGDDITVTFATEDANLGWITECFVTDEEGSQRIIYSDQTGSETKRSFSFAISDVGYYELTPTIRGHVEAGDEYTKVGMTYRFYVTNNIEDDTPNYQTTKGQLMLSNAVFQLSNNDANPVQYAYYDDFKNTVAHIKYGATYNEGLNKYNTDGSYTPTFSDFYIAKDYVKYMEYQDLHLVYLDSNICGFLSSRTGSNTYIAADTETHNPQVGQLWVRYKREGWYMGCSANYWAYYYYKDRGSPSENTIDLQVLLQNPAFESALNSVVDTIMSYGKTVYLVGGDDVDKSGSPKVSPMALHYNSESTTLTAFRPAFKENQQYITTVSYSGDQFIYRNTVTIGNDSYPLATNMPLQVSKHTQLYLLTSGNTDPTQWGELTSGTTGWIPLDAQNGSILGDLLYDSTGSYTILELCSSGARLFDVYVDKMLPTVKIKIGSATNDIILDNNTPKLFGETIYLSSMEGEVDPQAYVAVYTASTRELKYLYYATNLSSAVPLSDRNYIIRIGDRSGNVLDVNCYLASTPMEVTIKEDDSGILVIISGRSTDELQNYEVTLNNNRLSVQIPQPSGIATQDLRQRFKDPGTYVVKVTDIYGNRIEQRYSYKRSAPDVEWAYFNGKTYDYYDESNIVCMTIQPDKKLTDTYNIYTSALLRFRLVVPQNAGEATWEINGAKENIDYEYNTVTKTITMTKLTFFRLVVYYVGYEDNSVTYNVYIDSSAPLIEASYIGSDYSSVTAYAEDYPQAKAGDAAAPRSLVYGVASGSTKDVNNDEIIDGNFVIVRIDDEAGIRYVTLETNGGEPVPVTLKDGEFRIDNYGDYVIRATDMLGNSQEFHFTNTTESFSKAVLDDREIGCGLSEKYYGHGVLNICQLNEGTTEILVRYGTESFYGSYAYQDGSFVVSWFELVYDEGYAAYYCQRRTADTELFNSRKTNFEYNVPYQLAINDYFDLEVFVDKENQVNFTLTCLSGSIDVETLYTVSASKSPDYLAVEMSKETSNIVVYSGSKKIQPEVDGKMTFVGDTIWFDKISDVKIASVKIAYSTTETFDEYETVFTIGDVGTINYTAEDDGLYSVIIENIYGNTTEYLLSLSKSFFISALVTYADGAQTAYTYEDGLTIYLNGKVTLTAYAPNVTFTVNGSVMEATTTENSRSITLYGSIGNDTYDVIARDAGGVERRFRFVIFTDLEFDYNDSWIYGYNENALLRSEDYTNKKLSVTWSSDIYQVSIVKDDNVKVIYDLLSQQRIMDYSQFENCIGNDGDGDYIVMFRGQYGDLVKKTIHYCETPTLILTRATLAGGYTEDYDLNFAISKGFYSSNSLVFNSTAPVFDLVVSTGDGSRIIPATYPYILEFDSESGNGSFEYTVNYVDAYGFKYSFVACLLRQELLIGTSQMELVEIDGEYYTRDNVAITFDEAYNATVSRDGRDATPYRSGTALRADGKYRFEITDIAGNLRVFIVTHDSVINYSLVSGTGGNAVIKGGVSNANTVVFNIAEGDTGYIKHVIYNGVTQEGYSSNTFDLSGYWELLIEDRIGNTSYFNFYLLNYCVSEFDYDAPDGFTVSQVWITEKDGTRRLTPYSGDSIHLKNEGVYAVVLVSTSDYIATNFTVTVDKTPPPVKLKGCNNGETTPYEVTLEGLQYGDVVEIYKNGELLRTSLYKSSRDIPTFVDGGTYTVKVTNLAGVSQTFDFTKKYVANAATSIIIIIVCLAAMAGVLIGLLYRNCSKTDK